MTTHARKDLRNQELDSFDSDTLSLARPALASPRVSGALAPGCLLFIVFTASGFAGLIYESIWSHYLRLFLGHASYAQTLVLAIFMGGMAIGSALTSRYCPRWRNPLLVYAVAEGLVGLFGLQFHAFFQHGTAFAYSVVFPGLESALAIQALKWCLAALLILVQSILLGMTFPLISGAVVRRFPDSPGSSIATLYFTNSLGAAVGVLVSGFVLVPWVGLPGTIMTAGLLSVMLALVVWLMSRDPLWQDAPPLLAAKLASIPAEPGPYAPLLVVALVTGAASFMYEIAWIRMLSHVLGSSTHAFELIISAFIFGLACGSLWIRRRIDRWRDPVFGLGIIQVTMGVLALATLLSYSHSFEVMSFAMAKVRQSAGGYGSFNVVSHAIAFCVMLPATFCAGMTLPLVTRALIGEGYGEKSIGAAYAMNTIGAIIGIVVAVQLAMPALGLKGLMMLGAALDIGLGVYLLLRVTNSFSTGRVVYLGTLAASVLVATLLFVRLDPHSSTSAVYQHGSASAMPGVEHPFHRDGKTATVDLLSYPVGVVAITTNGKTDATINMVDETHATTDEITMVLLGAIPLAARPEAQRAAVIGFGSGLTTHVLLGSDTIEVVDTIEIESAMVDASQGFRPRVERAYSDSRSRVHIDDARAFFSARRERYDIIISEPSQPWVSGVSNLYSSEFYALVRGRLSESGVFAQWLHVRRMNPVLVASVVGALAQEFSQFAVYNTNGRDILILASAGETSAPDFQRVLAMPNVARELDRIGVHHAEDFRARRLGGARLMSSYYGSFAASHNSDFFPVLDLNAFRAGYLGQTATEVFALRNGPLPVVEMLDSRIPRDAHTKVSPDSPVASLRSTHVATQLRDFYADGVAFDRTSLPSRLRKAMSEIDRLILDCGPEKSDEHVITHLNRVAAQLAPFLEPKELVLIWNEYAECTELRSIHLQRWLSLLKAVSARDAGRMAVLSGSLLESGEDAIDAARMGYLVATSMLGHLSAGDRAGALVTWAKYGSPTMSNGELGAVLRLLIAYAQT